MTTTAGTKERTAETLRDEFITMREAGATYSEIGDAYGYSGEMVRRVLGPDFAGRPGRDEAARRQLARDVSDWLEANGPVLRDEVLDEFEITTSQLSALTQEFEVPTWLILNSARGYTPRQYDDAAIIDALRRAWKVIEAESEFAVGLAHAAYERVRDPDDPSAALLISRYGWANICAKAGVPTGYGSRPTDTYGSAWTDDEILRAVRLYVDVCRADRVRPSYLGYDAWQRVSDELPSGSLVRNRMRKIGLGTWGEIVAAAMKV